jgi:hypothetical protein
LLNYATDSSAFPLDASSPEGMCAVEGDSGSRCTTRLAGEKRLRRGGGRILRLVLRSLAVEVWEDYDLH